MTSADGSSDKSKRSGETQAEGAAPNDQAVRGFFENLLTSNAPKKG